MDYEKLTKLTKRLNNAKNKEKVMFYMIRNAIMNNNSIMIRKSKDGIYKVSKYVQYGSVLQCDFYGTAKSKLIYARSYDPNPQFPQTKKDIKANAESIAENYVYLEFNEMAGNNE